MISELSINALSGYISKLITCVFLAQTGYTVDLAACITGQAMAASMPYLLARNCRA